MERHILYVGVYTEPIGNCNGKGKGVEIFEYSVDIANKELHLKPVKTISAGINPSYLCISNENRFLFSANKAATAAGEVRSFRIAPDGLNLLPVDKQPSLGVRPAYLTCDPAGKFLYVANYRSANIVEYQIADDGKLEMKQNIQLEGGSKVVKNRQMDSHAHCFVFHPNGKFAYSCDLGDDKIVAFKFEDGKGITRLSKEIEGSAGPGQGVRHLVFNRSGSKAYVSVELSNEVNVYDVDQNTAKLTKKQVLSTLPPDFNESNEVSDIHITSNDKFVYVSNRGHDSIAMFKVLSDGLLTLIGVHKCGAQTPREPSIEQPHHPLDSPLTSSPHRKSIYSIYQELVCDPVMGDNGQYYVDKALMPGYRDILIPLADIVVPNQFELESLTGMKISNEEDLLKAVTNLHELTKVKVIVVTSTNLATSPDILYAYGIIFNKSGSCEKYRLQMPKFDGHFFGTGDSFASLLLVNMHKFDGDLKQALLNVVSSVHHVINDTYNHYKKTPSNAPANVVQAALELRLVQNQKHLVNPLNIATMIELPS